MSMVNLSNCCYCPVIYNGREAQCRSCGQRDPEFDRSPATVQASDAAKAHEAKLKAEARRAAIADCVAALEARYARGWDSSIREAINIVRGLDHE